MTFLTEFQLRNYEEFNYYVVEGGLLGFFNMNWIDDTDKSFITDLMLSLLLIDVKSEGIISIFFRDISHSHN